METASRTRRLARASNVTVRGGVLLTIAVFSANVSNYIFQVLAGRWLGPSEYGLLASVFTLISVFGVSASSLQAACAKGEAVRRVGGGDVSVEGRGAFDDPLVRGVLFVSVALGVIVVLLSPLLGRFFHSSTGPVIGFAALLPSVGLLAIVYGRLQGLERFLAFAVLSLGLALAKLTFGGVAVAIGAGVTGTIFALAATSTVGGLAGLLLTRNAAPLPTRELMGDTTRALIAMTVFWALLSLDVPLARHWLDHDASGQYAAASVIGKGILWLPDVVALIIFPSLATAVRAGTNGKRLLAKAVGLSTSLCLLGCLALFALGEPMFRVLYGDGYEGAASLAWKLGLATVPLAVANLLIFYFLARNTWAWILTLVGIAAASLAAFTLFHDSPNQFVAVTAVSAVALAMGLGAGVVRAPAPSDRSNAA